MNATSDLMSNHFTKLQANPVVSAVLSGEHVARIIGPVPDALRTAHATAPVD
jgi:hypothetical protein